MKQSYEGTTLGTGVADTTSLGTMPGQTAANSIQARRSNDGVANSVNMPGGKGLRFVAQNAGEMLTQLEARPQQPHFHVGFAESERLGRLLYGKPLQVTE